MRSKEGSISLSPSDLANHLACGHLTTLNLAAARGEMQPPKTDDQFLEVLRARGDDHERAYVAALRGQGLEIIDLSEHKFTDAAVSQTRDAMTRGAEVIVQAALADGIWAGYADVLVRVPRPSALGAWSYEVVDTKLAQETRGGTILQLCAYSDIVGTIQGRMPERFHVVTPGEPFVEEKYRFDEYAAYYRLVRGRLENAVGLATSGRTEVRPCDQPHESSTTYPEPVEHCDVCRWQRVCAKRRRDDDHLSLVAGIRRSQRDELNRHEVQTLTALAGLPLPLPFKPERGSREAMARVREQARIQLLGRTTGTPQHEMLPPEVDRGLHRLPAPSAGDIFLDFEGDPFAGKDGLEYLFGWATREADGGWTYHERWALDAEHEAAAFQELMAFVMARQEQWPDLHIYHYAPYEPSALKRLMGKYGVCGEELDRLLRGEVLVDLFAVTRQSLRASVERYSIKSLEPFYQFTRETPLEVASQALRQIEYLLETKQPVTDATDLRKAVASYNRDDCLSAAALRDWLEFLRGEMVKGGRDIQRPVPKSQDADEKLTKRDARFRALADRLLAGVPADSANRTPAQQASWLLAQTLGFHRREDKAVWWEFYRLTNLDDEQLLDEKEALVGLEFVGQVSAKNKTVVNRYRFPPQEADIREDAEAFEDAKKKIGTVVELHRDKRTIDIRHLAKTSDERPTKIITRKFYGTDVQADALYRIGEWGVNNAIDEPGPFLARAERLAVSLDDSTLAIQGPPGAGKTYTGAQIICELVKAGKTVGVCATGHKVIRHQITEALKAAQRAGVDLRCAHKPAEPSAVPDGIRDLESNPEVEGVLAGREADVIGGTTWLWARPEFANTLDVLVIDEAGQMSFANVLAVSQAARSLVLLGDPQQLEQPLKASHPDGSAASVLQHVLEEHQTMPAERGLFIGETWRLAPAICRFTSESFYESRVHPRAGLDRQVLANAGDFSGAGLWYLPVEHDGNQNFAPEEVDAVQALVNRLTTSGTTWIDAKGNEKALTLDDILIVAPYNAQVYAIAERIPGARVGTVDRFQGQEAAVVICSMATSTADDAPRGMGFLYSRNRLNVATSRARCAVIMVASPALFTPGCQTPGQMKLANAWCRFAELAEAHRIDPAWNSQSTGSKAN
jgi:predicted RecB family nuclease